MKHIKLIIVAMLLVFTGSCKNATKNNASNFQDKNENIVEEGHVNPEELKYVINDSFPVGDVRRYGIAVDGGNPIHPLTKKPTYETVCDISQELGIEIFFPKGYYKDGLIIRGKKNVTINFDESEFAGPIYIIEDNDKNRSENIVFKGVVTTYNKFYTRYSSDISIDTLNIISNIDLSQNKLRSLGCDIFRGTESLDIKSLFIDDLGSGANDYLTSSALSIHGWSANPKNVTINDVHIESSDLHGAYITGEEIIIENITIESFGRGNSKPSLRMQDTAKGEEQYITGLWLNICNNSTIGNVTINTEKSKGKYAVWLDSGNVGKPTVIENITLIGGDSKLPIYAEETTNVVVERLEKK